METTRSHTYSRYVHKITKGEYKGLRLTEEVSAKGSIFTIGIYDKHNKEFKSLKEVFEYLDS